MYEIGKVYIWQHQIGIYAFLNGMETTVMEGPFEFVDPATHRLQREWVTDSPVPASEQGPGQVMMAYPGDLRPKEPPKGERLILDLFKLPEVELA